MDTINCPECNSEILSRMGTICPNCGYTVGYFNGDKKRKAYGKFFAKTVFLPFVSFVLLILTSSNFYFFLASVLVYGYLAFKSCPIFAKDLFATVFERRLFWGIWMAVNALMISIIYNVFSKF